MIRKLLVLVLFLGFLQMIEDTKKIGTGQEQEQEETQQEEKKDD